ncbi:glycine receptor subunit alpha-2 isoform X2 [Procambarus clarkii]
MLWKPEVYFPNAKDSDFQYVTVPNVMLRIHPDGSILYILRLKLTFSCMMDLSSFPLDHQTCYIQIASFVKTTRELELVWYEHTPIKMYKRLKLPQFEMKEIRVDSCNQSFHIGNYSCLQAVFDLRRNIGYHLVQSYLPTSLIVVVSWVSFWLDVDAIPSRVTLGVTTLLTVCSESTSFRDKMPTVSYVKALDIWMGSCTAFVFLALVEFTVVNHIARHHRRFLFWGSVYGQPAISPQSSTPHHHHHPTSLGRLSSTECPTHGSIYACVRAASQGGHAVTLMQRQDASKHVRKKSTISLTVETRRAEDEQKRRRNSSGGETRQREDQVVGASSCGHAPDVYRVTSGGHAAEASSDDLNDDLDPGVCSRALSDVGLACLPSLWRQEAVLAKRIDKTCRALFPALFILFNLVYWLYYQVFT